MKVVYLLNGASLYGGVKVVFQHAVGLRKLGVEAEVVSPDPPHDWFRDAQDLYRRVDPLEPATVGPADISVGTIYFTVPTAARITGAIPFHLCQCYEGLYEEARDLWPEIDAAYRLPTWKLAVSPHLVEILRQRFGESAQWIPQPFRADLFCPPALERPDDGTFRVLLAGTWELPIKGVQWAMDELSQLAREHPRLVIVRLSQTAPRDEVERWPGAERHVAVPPESVPDIVRGVDAYLGASTEVEGFGLPALEAMGCGRPCVLTDIGATRSLDPTAAASLRVPLGDGETLRRAVRRLRDEPELRRRLGAAGREIAVQYTEERTSHALLRAFEGALAHP